MAVAVSIITESSDHYLYVMDGKPSHQEVNDYIKEQLGDEFNYISTYQYEATFKSKTEFTLDRNEDE